MSIRVALGAGLFAALALASAGCSLVLDPEQKQCKADTQCALPYVCGPAGFCEKKTGCEVDADCRDTGVCREGICERPTCKTTEDCDEGGLCDTSTLVCADEKQAICKAAADCENYDNAGCNVSLGQCRELECKKKPDCGTSPTVTCEKGFCEDPLWGCLGDPDLRVGQNMSTQGSLEFKVIYIFPATGQLETGVADLSVRVCQVSDVTCATSVSDDWTYENNLLTIRGLENGKRYVIRLEANHPSTGMPLLETEYQMYRTVVGKTADPRPIVMFEATYRQQTAMVANVTADPMLGIVLAYTLDCQGVEVAGVSVAVDKMTIGCMGDPKCATTPFYFTTANLPDPDSTQTSLAGRLGVANMLPDTPNRLTLKRTADDKVITSFVVTPRPNIITFTFFYPQNYGPTEP